jgi:hypothetical protein
MHTARRSVKTKHHSNLRPKHKHTKDFLKVYWPYMPLLIILASLTLLLSPWNYFKTKDVLGYATNITPTGLLETTNSERQKANSTPLQMNEKLSRAAQAKADDMVARDYWSHNTPEQQSPWVFIDKTGYSYQKAGENLAYGFASNNQVIAGWLNSASHRANMLESNFNEVGFGIANSKNFVSVGKSTIVVALYAKQGAASTTELATAPTQHSVQSQSINRIQMITNGTMPWLSYVVGIITGAALMYIFVKHSLAFKRAISKSERFIIKHPILDATLIAVAILGIVLSKQIGIIL